MNHNDKVYLATKMNNGIRNGCFNSAAWKARRKQRLLKEASKKSY